MYYRLAIQLFNDQCSDGSFSYNNAHLVYIREALFVVCILVGGRNRVPQLMARPQAIPGVPYGLEYLTQVDQLLVHQQIEIFEGKRLMTHQKIDRKAL